MDCLGLSGEPGLSVPARSAGHWIVSAHTRSQRNELTETAFQSSSGSRTRSYPLRFRAARCGYSIDMAMALSVASAIVGLCTTFALAIIATNYHERVSVDSESEGRGFVGP
jgi:hypothetical protein